MKIKFKQFLFSLMGLLFLSQVYSANTGSTEMGAATDEMAAPEAEPMLNKATAATQEPETNPKSNASVEKNDAMTGFSRGTVARSIFTTLIDNREPVDKVKQVPEKNGDVFYFTELRDMSGQTAKHRWEYKGKVIAEVDFKVRGPRWRVWSKKSFQPGWAGDWKVSVLNGADEVISEEMIAFTEPSQPIQDKIQAPIQDTMQNKSKEKAMGNEMQTSPNVPSDPALN